MIGYIALGLRKYTLQRTIVRQGEKEGNDDNAGTNSDIEKGTGDSDRDRNDEETKEEDEKVPERLTKEDLRDCNETIGSKTVDGGSVRPATGTTIGSGH